MAGLLEDSRVLRSASAFSLWPYVVLMEEYEGKSGPAETCIWEKGIF